MIGMSRPLLRQALEVPHLHTRSRAFTISRIPSISTKKSTQHEKEDFYQYYFNYKLHNQDLGRKLWPKQPVAPNPDLTLLGDQQSNANSVAYVLDCFARSHQRHADQPITKTLAQYREAKPGSLALQWLLSSGKTSELSHWEHSRLLKLIVHCLIAEGNLGILTEWMLAKDAPTQSTSKFMKYTQDAEIWRGLLLSYTVQAQAYWTQGSLLLEESVQSYLSMSIRAQGQVYIPHSLAANWLYHLLSLKIRPSVAATTHEQFWDMMTVWRTNNLHALEFAQARLSMTHPLRPDPFPALRLMQKHADSDWDTWVAQFVDPTRRDASAMGWLFFVMAAQLLAKEGNIDPAKWVLDLGRKSLPLKFQMSKFKGGSPSNTRRRLPTQEEAAAGLVDSEGYWLSMRKRVSVYANNAAASSSPPERRASDSPFSEH